MSKDKGIDQVKGLTVMAAVIARLANLRKASCRKLMGFLR